jgi:hypothetical protein
MVLIPRIIHDHAANLMHADETKPKINVRRLVIERRWYWGILVKSRTARIDDECLGDVEAWPIFFAVIGELVIALSG